MEQDKGGENIPSAEEVLKVVLKRLERARERVKQTYQTRQSKFHDAVKASEAEPNNHLLRLNAMILGSNLDSLSELRLTYGEISILTGALAFVYAQSNETSTQIRAESLEWILRLYSQFVKDSKAQEEIGQAISEIQRKFREAKKGLDWAKKLAEHVPETSEE